MEHLKVYFGSKRNPILFSTGVFKGKKLLDIRKQFTDSSGEMTPTKKGISLNPHQMQELLELLVKNISFLNDFFDIDILPKNIDSLIINGTTTIGRSFAIDFDNDKRSLIIDSQMLQKLEKAELEFFSKILLSLYEALFDILDDDHEIESILDAFDKYLRNKI